MAFVRACCIARGGGLDGGGAERGAGGGGRRVGKRNWEFVVWDWGLLEGSFGVSHGCWLAGLKSLNGHSEPPLSDRPRARHWL